MWYAFPMITISMESARTATSGVPAPPAGKIKKAWGVSATL